MEHRPAIVGPDEGEPLWFFGMLVQIYVSGDQSEGQFCLNEQYGRRGVATPLHRQLQDQETFYILEGELRFYLEDDSIISATPGTSIYIPAGKAHAFDIVSETARWLNLTTPRHEAFFRAAGDPATERTLPPDMPPDMPRVMAAADQYGVEIIGPPPGAHRAYTH
jgi:mannose-6-phosphate isomerase-like protein (cupin superfamily)